MDMSFRSTIAGGAPCAMWSLIGIKVPGFLAHLSRRLIGELLVYRGIRRPSVVNIFKRLLL